MTICQRIIVLLPLWVFARVAFAEGIETKVTGSARLRYEDSFAKDPISPERTAFSSIRIRPSFQVTVNPELNLVVEPQFAKIFGAQSLLPNSTTTNATTDTSGSTAYAGDTIGVFQGYLEIKLSDNSSFVGGRQTLKYGDELILGASDWGTYGRSFDALKFRYSENKTFIDLFAAKVVENNIVNSKSGGDKDLSGVYVSWAVSDTIKAFDTYYFYLYDARDATLALPADAGRPAFFSTYGARWVVASDKLSWNFEYAQNQGSEGSSYVANDENSNNNMLDTELAYFLNEETKSKISLEVFRGEANWRELFPTTAKQLGRTDVVGRRNLSGLGAHYTTLFSEKFGLDADAFIYQRTSSSKPVYATDSKTAVGAVANSSSQDVGQEIDLIGKYLSNKNLIWSLGINVFVPGRFIKDNQGNDSGRTTHYGFIMAESKF